MANLSDILLIGGGLYLLSRKAGTGIAQQISIASNIRFQLRGADAQSIRFTLQIPVSNNSSISVPIGRFDGKLFYGNYPLTAVSLSEPVTLQAGQSTWMIVNGEIDYSEMTGTVKQVWESGQLLQSLFLRGTLYYSLGGAELGLPINYQVYAI